MLRKKMNKAVENIEEFHRICKTVPICHRIQFLCFLSWITSSWVQFFYVQICGLLVLYDIQIWFNKNVRRFVKWSKVYPLCGTSWSYFFKYSQPNI